MAGPGFPSIDDVIKSLTVNGKGQRLEIQKVLPSTNVANIYHTLWTSNGIPVAGSYPAAGLGSAAVCTKATSGGLPYVNPTAPATMHLLSAGASSQTAAGILMICDRICHARITNNQATGNFAPNLDATSRLAAGEGAMMIIEVVSALSAAANVRTFTYTKEDGTSGRVTPNLSMVASSIVGRVPYASGLYVPLADGDMGIRSVQSTTLVSGTATGDIAIVLVRPLAMLNIPNLSVWIDRDFVVELPNMPRLYDSSCISAYMISATANATFTWNAVCRVSEN